MIEEPSLFQVLEKLDSKNKNFIDSLSEKQIKKLSTYMLMKWMVSCQDPRKIIFINELVNPVIFNFSKHQLLLMYLLMICGSGTKTRYNYIKLKKDEKFPLSVGVVKEYFNYNTKHAKEAIPLLSNDDIIGYASQLGYQQEDLKLLNKELKSR
jgi:hypothetical protein